MVPPPTKGNDDVCVRTIIRLHLAYRAAPSHARRIEGGVLSGGDQRPGGGALPGACCMNDVRVASSEYLRKDVLEAISWSRQNRVRPPFDNRPLDEIRVLHHQIDDLGVR